MRVKNWRAPLQRDTAGTYRKVDELRQAVTAFVEERATSRSKHWQTVPGLSGEPPGLVKTWRSPAGLARAETCQGLTLAVRSQRLESPAVQGHGPATASVLLIRTTRTPVLRIRDIVGVQLTPWDAATNTGCNRRRMLAYVKRTTVKISDALDARLRHEAQRRGVTIAAISREALEAYLGGPSTRRRLGAAGVGHSGRTDVSERIEEILTAELAR